MRLLPLGNSIVSLPITDSISEASYLTLRPTLRGILGDRSVAHVERREKLLGRNLDHLEKLLAYFLALGIFTLDEREIIIDLSKWSGAEIPGRVLSEVLSKYISHLSRDGLAIRSINNVPLFTSFSGSLEEKLTGIFGDRAEAVANVCSAVEDEISRMELVTMKSMAGLHGGVVGKAHVGETSVIFKVETNFLAAYKSVRAPYMIHDFAASDARAAVLARRIPQPLTSFPMSHGSYWITLAEDFSHTFVPASSEDLRVMAPELQQGLVYSLVEPLYLAALYQEVMSSILQTMSDPLLMVQSTILSNLPEEELQSRLQSSNEIYEQIKPIVEPLLARVQDGNAYLAEISGQDFVHGDFKSVHRKKGAILDTGCTRQDSQVIDLGRIFMDQPASFLSASVFTSYVDAFVRMRQLLNPTYEPPVNLATTAALQTMNDTLRNLGWELQQGSFHNIGTYVAVLERLDAMIKL